MVNEDSMKSKSTSARMKDLRSFAYALTELKIDHGDNSPTLRFDLGLHKV